MEDTPFIKKPMPGYGIAIIDKDEDDGEDKFDTPQVGKLILINPTEKDRERYDYELLIQGTIYWKKYSDQDATFFDKDLGEDVVFIKLDAIVGFDED